MAGVNRCIFVGNLTADPEVRYSGNGDAVASFTVACNETWKDKDGEKQERVEYVRVVAWKKLGEICGEYLFKGKQVYVEGRMQTREWEDKDENKRYTTEIIINNMTMLGQAATQQSQSQRND